MDVAAIEKLPETTCRLCGGQTKFKFEKVLLRNQRVRYWECATCNSLQTDIPTWLEAAYADPRPVLDVGMLWRTLRTAQLTNMILRIAGVGPKKLCVDWGGGNGLFTRAMRDLGFNFRSYDKYVKNYYSVGFEYDADEAGPVSVLTSFEVFEHLPNPDSDLDEIFKLQPDLWLFSTVPYHDQGPEWSYLAPHFGRHIFFYAPKALRDLARRHGYDAFVAGHIHLFVRKSGPYLKGSLTRRLASRCLREGRATRAAGTLLLHWAQRRTPRRWRADRTHMERQWELKAPGRDSLPS